tara:strand:- start:28 stop:588 length:561 start_codon:yes stop_codon:yes gene_type:complete
LRKKICVFGGSKSGKNSENIKSAKIVGQIIAENNFDIVFGGGENGIMGSVSETAIKYGSKTTGIIPNFLIKKDIQETKHSNKYNTHLIITENMHQRKQMMYEKSDAFLILPGGVGTLDECFEVLTWCQLNQIVNKKIGIINFNNFWDPLISLINHLISEGYMGSNNLNYFEELRNKNSLKFFLKNI